MRERSISDTLWDLGVVHVRDPESTTDGCHTLYYAGRPIGRYSAHQVADLIREHGLDDDTSLSRPQRAPIEKIEGGQ